MAKNKVLPENIKNMSFEQAISELETITKQLEQGKIPLSNAVEIFERGSLLKIHCDNCLSIAQAKIEKINLSNDDRS